MSLKKFLNTDHVDLNKSPMFKQLIKNLKKEKTIPTMKNFLRKTPWHWPTKSQFFLNQTVTARQRSCGNSKRLLKLTELSNLTTTHSLVNCLLVPLKSSEIKASTKKRPLVFILRFTWQWLHSHHFYHLWKWLRQSTIIVNKATKSTTNITFQFNQKPIPSFLTNRLNKQKILTQLTKRR